MSACAIARLVMGPPMNIQAPPNLSADYGAAAAGRHQRLGRGLPPHPGLRQPGGAPGPTSAELGALCAEAGYALRERLTIYPEYLADDDFVDPGLRAHVRALADDDGSRAPARRSRVAAVAA